MTEHQAIAVAEALGGRVWQSGGNIWLVRFADRSGRIVVISEEMICDYANEAAFAEGRESKAIVFPGAHSLSN